MTCMSSYGIAAADLATFGQIGFMPSMNQS